MTFKKYHLQRVVYLLYNAEETVVWINFNLVAD